MNYLKLTKNKARLFLSFLLATLIVAALFILVNRFLIINYYQAGQIFYHQLINFLLDIIRYAAIAYLTIAFYKKKFSPQGEYYAIFKFALLLAVFSFLYHLFLSGIGQQAPNIFFSNWVNAGFIVINLAWYYLLVCIVYGFAELKNKNYEK